MINAIPSLAMVLITVFGVPTAHPVLRHDAQTYTDAYVTGDAETAWAILSPHCQRQIGKHHFLANAAEAVHEYGQDEQITAFRATVSGSRASLTYSFATAPGLDRVNEPWVRVAGAWRDNDC